MRLLVLPADIHLRPGEQDREKDERVQGRPPRSQEPVRTTLGARLQPDLNSAPHGARASAARELGPPAPRPAGTQTGAGREQGGPRAPLQALAQLGRCGDDQRAQLVERGSARPRPAPSRVDQKRAQSLRLQPRRASRTGPPARSERAARSASRGIRLEPPAPALAARDARPRAPARPARRGSGRARRRRSPSPRAPTARRPGACRRARRSALPVAARGWRGSLSWLRVRCVGASTSASACELGVGVDAEDEGDARLQACATPPA